MRLPKGSGKKLADVIEKLAEKLGGVFGRAEKEVLPKAEFGAKRVVSEASKGEFKRPPAELIKKSTMQKQNLSAKINTEMLGKAQDELLRLQKEYKDYVKANPRIEYMAMHGDNYRQASKGDKQKASRLQNLKELIRRAEKDVMDYQVKIINKEMVPGMEIDLEPRSKRMADAFEKSITGQKDILTQMLEDMRKPAFQKQIKEQRMQMFEKGNKFKVDIPMLDETIKLTKDGLQFPHTYISQGKSTKASLDLPVMIDDINFTSARLQILGMTLRVTNKIIETKDWISENYATLSPGNKARVDEFLDSLYLAQLKVAALKDNLFDAYQVSMRDDRPVRLNTERAMKLDMRDVQEWKRKQQSPEE